MRKTLKRMLILLVTLWIVSACSGQNDSNEAMENNAGNQPADGAGQDMAAVEEQDFDNEQRAEGDNVAQEVIEPEESDRQIIYEGDIHLEVQDYRAAVTDIERQIEEVNGYLVESATSRSGEDGTRSGRMVIRIPQENFFSFIADLEESDAEVLEQYTSGRDVTEEYVDLESRLSSQQAVEERLMTFMDDAETTEDLLNISSQLTDVQEEIETIQGRMNYLENRVDYSTLHVYLNERPATEIQDREDLETWERAVDQFMGTINGLIRAAASATVFIVGFSPVLIPVLLIAGIIYAYKRRKNQTNVEQNKEAEESGNRSDENGSSEKTDK
ncbi:DUF4349 domain-containing protein [Salisediminibacterium beveridgei]|nr:DUF4349 domain-containing protein [Salisediminibacterium beveridgei]